MHQGGTDMFVRFFPSHTAFLSRFGDSRWLVRSFVLGGFFVAFCGEAPPTAVDLSKIEITLQRSPCLGTCPNYKVTIRGDGRVVFTTETLPGLTSTIGVVLPGTHEDRIAPETVAALFERFRKAGFFDLRSAYQFPATDLPTYVLTIDTGQRRRSVEDYGGRVAGMPKVVTELEDAVDNAAGTDRWVRGSTGLIAWLEGQHFDFRSTEAAQLAASAAHEKADEAMVIALIDHGAPLDSEVSGYGPKVVKMIQERDPAYTPPPAGFSLMESAIRRGQVGLFKKLVASGWLERLGKERAAQVFAQSAAGCSSALVDVAADAGIDIDKTEAPGNAKPAITHPYGKTALGNLATSPWCRHREADRVATARRLLARGADPNHRDASGHTALYGAENPVHGAENPDMVKLLLAHGAERR
jgi:hypothetical protein